MRGYLAHTLVIGEICGVVFATKPGFVSDLSFKPSVTSEKPVCSTLANDGSQISKFSYHFLHTCSIDSCFELTGPHRGDSPHFSKLTSPLPFTSEIPLSLESNLSSLGKVLFDYLLRFLYSRLLPQNS